MKPAPDHRRPASRHAWSSAQSTGLLASILAECTRGRRGRGSDTLAVTLDVAPAHEQALVADAALLRRVLEPLVRRAMASAMQTFNRSESPVLREVVVTTVDVGDAIEIEVADSGPSLPPRVRKWLGEPADSPHESNATPDGAGLALAAVRAAAARIDGTLSAADCPEGGVAITLRLPRRLAARLAA